MEYRGSEYSSEKKSTQYKQDQTKWDVLMDTGQRSLPVQGMLDSFMVISNTQRETLSDVKEVI